jgi:type I restriction enzyme, S subunit
MIDLPSHWSLRRLRNVADMRVSNVDKHEREGEIPVRLCNYVDVYKNERITQGIPFMHATATPAEILRFRLRENDVLITKDSEAWRDIGVPALVEYAAPDLVSGYHLALLRPRAGQVTGAFLLRALQSASVASQLHVAATGVTRYGLSHAAIKSVVLPIPTLSEQAAIVRFLDHTDRRIRRAVRSKQKLIALLMEQKQAVIHQAVMRGLDPNVRLKPSQVDWLGDVPRDWEVMQLRRLVRRGRRITYGIVQPGEPDPSGRFMVRGQDYSFGWAKPESLFRVSDAIETPYRRSRLESADLVLTIVGAGVGNVAKVPPWLDGANITQTTARISIDGAKAEPDFVAATLDSPVGRRNVERYVKGAAQPGLNLEHVRLFLIPVPPLSEQREILRAIRGKADGLSDAVEHARRAIDLLREYRVRLIVDVVTGRLDVQRAPVQLPEEPDELALLDEIDVEDSEATALGGVDAVEA